MTQSKIALTLQLNIFTFIAVRILLDFYSLSTALKVDPSFLSLVPAFAYAGPKIKKKDTGIVKFWTHRRSQAMRKVLQRRGIGPGKGLGK